MVSQRIAMEIKIQVPDFVPNLDEFFKHLRNARVETWEAVKALAQARIEQLQGKKGAKLKRIEVK